MGGNSTSASQGLGEVSRYNSMRKFVNKEFRCLKQCYSLLKWEVEHQLWSLNYLISRSRAKKLILHMHVVTYICIIDKSMASGDGIF